MSNKSAEIKFTFDPKHALANRIRGVASILFNSTHTRAIELSSEKIKCLQFSDDDSKSTDKHFPTAKLTLAIDGVVMEDVPAAFVNISHAAPPEYRGKYMVNEDIGVFGFIRYGRVFLFPLVDKKVLSLKNDQLLDLTEILSAPSTEEVTPVENATANSSTVENLWTDPQPDNKSVDDSWKSNPENLVRVYLSKLTGPIGSEFTTTSYRPIIHDQKVIGFEINNDQYLFDNFIGADGEVQHVVHLEDEVPLNQVKEYLNINFKSSMEIPAIMLRIYDSFGGTSIICVGDQFFLSGGQIATFFRNKYTTNPSFVNFTQGMSNDGLHSAMGGDPWHNPQAMGVHRMMHELMQRQQQVNQQGGYPFTYANLGGHNAGWGGVNGLNANWMQNNPAAWGQASHPSNRYMKTVIGETIDIFAHTEAQLSVMLTPEDFMRAKTERSRVGINSSYHDTRSVTSSWDNFPKTDELSSNSFHAGYVYAFYTTTEIEIDMNISCEAVRIGGTLIRAIIKQIPGDLFDKMSFSNNVDIVLHEIYWYVFDHNSNYVAIIPRSFNLPRHADIKPAGSTNKQLTKEMDNLFFEAAGISTKSEPMPDSSAHTLDDFRNHLHENKPDSTLVKELIKILAASL